jgi:hypothetical protein
MASRLHVINERTSLPRGNANDRIGISSKSESGFVWLNVLFQAEKNGLKDKMLNEIQLRRKRLKDERQSLTIDASTEDSLAQSLASVYSARKSRRRQGAAAGGVGNGSSDPFFSEPLLKNALSSGGGFVSTAGGANGAAANPNQSSRQARKQQPQMASLDFPLKDGEIMEDLMLFARLGNSNANGASSRRGNTSSKRLRYR